jgi:microcin C transport system substrate-binding protein
MFGSYKRVVSYFQNSAMEAVGPPGPDELKILEPLRGKVDDSVFGDPMRRRSATVRAATARC